MRRKPALWTMRTLNARVRPETARPAFTRVGYELGALDFGEAEARLIGEAMRTCPRPVQHGGDERRCPACGRVWAIDEDRPACERIAPNRE
jgi:hypothetical protein